MAKVTTEEELTNAIKNNEDTIEIAGAVSTLGSNTTIGVIIIAVAIAGAGIGILNKLRKYRIEKVSEKHIILHKK